MPVAPPVAPADLRADQARWERTLLLPAQKKALRREVFRRSTGAAIDPLYRPRADTADHEAERLGFPGQFPFTRGVQPTMYRGRLWTMRQYAGFGTATESNARYRYLLGQGQTGLSVAFACVVSPHSCLLLLTGPCSRPTEAIMWNIARAVGAECRRAAVGAATRETTPTRAHGHGGR